MLAEFRVSNFRSFKDEQVLNLVATRRESMNGNSRQVGGYHILKMAAIYGANASGKSNLIRAMNCMLHILENSAGYKPGGKLPVEPFLFDEDTRKQPSSFEITFFIDDVRHQYGFSAWPEKIRDEWLVVYPANNRQTWFERWIGEDGLSHIKFGSFLKGSRASLWSRVKENSLFLSVAAQWNHEQLSKIYKWVDQKIRLLPDLDTARWLTDEMFFDAKEDRVKGGEAFFAALVSAMQQADLGITGLDIEQVSIDQLKIPDEIPIAENVRARLLEQLKAHPPYSVTAYHQTKTKGQSWPLSFEEESEGTKRFYSYMGPLIESVASGYTILRDELESSLHPLLTRELIETVKSGGDERVGAQLIFTTHDTTLLDPELFGRDQVWFTEKDADGATQLYSLADYKEKPRKGEAMQKRYLAGRYGAVPILERFDLSRAAK